MRKIIYILLCMLALTGCQKGRTYFPKDLKPQELDIVRFDNALMNVHETTVAQDIRVLYDEYPVFMPLWVKIYWAFRVPTPPIWSKPCRSS